jgi:hypothetical protein
MFKVNGPLEIIKRDPSHCPSNPKVKISQAALSWRPLSLLSASFAAGLLYQGPARTRLDL